MTELSLQREEHFLENKNSYKLIKSTSQTDSPHKIKVNPSDFYKHITCLICVVCYLLFQPTINHVFLWLLTSFSSSNQENWSSILKEMERNSSITCPIYVAPTSLPMKSSMGLYVMTSNEKKSIIDLNIFGNHSVRVWNPNTNSYISVPVYTLLWNPHATWYNVESNRTAIRDIAPFEEIFYNPNKDSTLISDDHNQDNDWNIAYSMVEMIWSSLHEHESIENHIIFNLSRRTQRVFSRGKKSRSFTSTNKHERKTSIWNVIREILKKYDTHLAALLPSTEEDARQIMLSNQVKSPGTTIIEKRKSRKWIERNGICYNPNIIVPSRQPLISVYSTRQFQQGDIMETSPLYAVSTEEQEKHKLCVNMVVHSLKYPNVTFCPLSNVAFVRDAEESQCQEEVYYQTQTCKNNTNANARLEIVSLFGNEESKWDVFNTKELIEVRFKKYITLRLIIK